MAKSYRRVGHAFSRTGLRGPIIYEALVAVECGQCQRGIQPGERFTKRAPRSDRLRPVPVCRQCVPFEEAKAR